MLDHILHIQWLIFYELQTVQIEGALDSWFPDLKFGHYAGGWMTMLLTTRPSSIHDWKWHLFQSLNLLSLTFEQYYTKFQGEIFFFLIIHPLVVYHIKHCRQPQPFLLVPPTHGTCFGHTDHLQALKIQYLKLKIKCTYSDFVRSHKLYRSY